MNTLTVNMEHTVLTYTLVELREVVQCLTARGESRVGINRLLRDTYMANNLPDDSTIRRWRREFINGRTSLQNETSSERPHDSRTAENIELVRQLIKEDSCYTLTELPLCMPNNCQRRRLIPTPDSPLTVKYCTTARNSMIVYISTGCSMFTVIVFTSYWS